MAASRPSAAPRDDPRRRLDAGRPLTDTSLTDAERGVIARYVELLVDRLGDRLVAVTLFGSAARGDMWPATSPMHSDIDLLVVTRGPVAPELAAELVDATYPLFLEVGRQISPQLFEQTRLAANTEKRVQALVERVAADGVALWPAGGS